MLKTIKGIYENGKIRISKEDLPKTDEKLEVIVVFFEADSNKQGLEIEVPFSITNGGFFSLSPEHLGKISTSDLNEIIAEEAIGQK